MIRFFAVFLVCAGCMMTPTQRREDSLMQEARTFNDDLRWARYETLATSLPKDEAQLFLARANAVGDDLVMADYEVKSIDFGHDSESAKVSVTFQWYSRRTSIVRSTTLGQQWQMRNGRWMVTKQWRQRGDRFPLVPEPVTPPAPAAPP